MFNYMCKTVCCQRQDDEIEVKKESGLKNNLGIPGMKSGDFRLPEPSMKQFSQQSSNFMAVEALPAISPPSDAMGGYPPMEFEDQRNVTPPASPRTQNRNPLRKITPPASWQPSLFVVELQKTEITKKVGLEADLRDEQTLKIVVVKDGLIRIYNEAAEESKQIKVGDKIIEVNGISGNCKKMLEAIGHDKKLRFVVQRRTELANK